MKILFDQGTPAPLRAHFPGHEVATAHELGWGDLANGELLRQAEQSFDVLITTDQSLRHQQNLTGKRLAIVVLPTTSWPRLQAHADQIVAAVLAVHPSELLQITFPP